MTGRVQGVGFRWSCREQAELLGVAGSVRNRPDGSVEAVAEGDAERVSQFVDWFRVDPRHARVIGVDVTNEPSHGATGFTVTG